MTATVDHDLASVEPEAPEPPRSRSALVAWVVVAALVLAVGGAWVVNRETLLAQWQTLLDVRATAMNGVAYGTSRRGSPSARQAATSGSGVPSRITSVPKPRPASPCFARRRA